MFDTVEKNQNVSEVLRMEVAMRADKINEWIDGNFEMQLIEKDQKINTEEYPRHFDANGTLKFNIDLLPHPNGVDTIFYHHRNNSFGNYLDANLFSLIQEAKNNKVDSPEKQYLVRLADNVTTIKWTLHKSGYIQIIAVFNKDVSEESGKYILEVPTEEVAQLQYGNRIAEEEQIVALDADTGIQEIRRAPLGIGEKGVAYYNKLCQVKVYLPEEETMYK